MVAVHRTREVRSGAPRQIINALRLLREGQSSMTPNPHREAGVDSRLRDAAHGLLRQWNAYRESDLNQMNAHDLLVRYELWNALDAALWEKPATNQQAGAALPIVRRLRRRIEILRSPSGRPGIVPVNPDGPEAAALIEELVATCKQMADDYQTSDQHHPDHVLVRRDAFDALRALLAKLEGDA
jgi:hypothetical protein